MLIITIVVRDELIINDSRLSLGQLHNSQFQGLFVVIRRKKSEQNRAQSHNKEPYNNQRALCNLHCQRSLIFLYTAAIKKFLCLQERKWQQIINFKFLEERIHLNLMWLISLLLSQPCASWWVRLHVPITWPFIMTLLIFFIHIF